MSPTSQLLEDVASAVRLQEGPEGVAQVIRLVGASGKLTLKDLARAVGLPVPVLAAVRHELEGRDLLRRDGGLVLSLRGLEVLGDLGGPWSPAACPLCNGGGVVVPERYHGVLHKLGELWGRRPEVDVRLDQSFALPESNLRRSLFALDRGALLGKRVLFLGDDDAGSLAVALLARELGSDVRVTALDIDGRVLEYLRSAAASEALDVDLVEHDVREPLPAELRERYDTVLTDPPYTVPGLQLFLSRALEATGPRRGASIFLSFGRRPPEEASSVIEGIARMSLAISELRPTFNRYEGASVLAGTSDLYHLIVTEVSRPAVQEAEADGRYEGMIYSGELRPHVREYVCRECHTEYKVGSGREWQTIEALKGAGCPRCGGYTFDQRRRDRLRRGR